MIPRPLQVLTAIRVEMQAGVGLSPAIRKVCSSERDPFRRSLLSWLVRTEAGHSEAESEASLPELVSSPIRRAMLRTLRRGLQGASIGESLVELEQEFYFAAETAYERQLQVLPLKLLVPLTLFILPALLLLIAGPLLFNLQGGFAR